MIRTVTGDLADISGPILCHEHLQIDLCRQKGPEVDIMIRDVTEGVEGTDIRAGIIKICTHRGAIIPEASYDAVFSDFFPMLRERGVSADQIDVMMCQNPRRILNMTQ